MPSKNETKIYIADSYYHIYNRCVEQRTIFLDQQDYAVFLSYLKNYLIPKNEEKLRSLISQTTSSRKRDMLIKILRMKNYAGEIRLHAFTLMPNHFHLLIHQKSPTAMPRFIHSLQTRYGMYFNLRYKRTGGLCEGNYKAVRVESDAQLLELTRYIHRNPLPLLQGEPLESYKYSSYDAYIGNQSLEWLYAEPILRFFSKENPLLSYKAFVEHGQNLELISSTCIDEFV